MKKYRIKKTLKLIKKLKPYWEEWNKLYSEFRDKEYKLEKKMEKELNIPDAEFFYCDNACVGIGNGSRTMELIHDAELEEGKIHKI